MWTIFFFYHNSRVCVHAESLQSCLTLRPRGLWPTRLLCRWDSPGKNTRVGCHFLFQGTFLTQGRTQVSCIGRWVHNHWAPGSPFVRLGCYPLWLVATLWCASLVMGGGVRMEGCVVGLCTVLWLAGGPQGFTWSVLPSKRPGALCSGQEVVNTFCLVGFSHFQNNSGNLHQILLPRYFRWRSQWQRTPVLLPGKSHGRRSLVGWNPWGR